MEIVTSNPGETVVLVVLLALSGVGLLARLLLARMARNAEAYAKAVEVVWDAMPNEDNK